ncbi:MAG: hypothetical protein NTW32_05250 [Chloroflexi bacterium]|nr:hypothetical protein [Chloroflexota bacterium]
MFKHIGFRILAAIVLLAAIFGIAAFAFNAGVARGTVLNLPAPAPGQIVPNYAYGLPYMHHMPFFGLGFLGLLLPLFLVFLAFGAARRMLWGPRFGWRHMHHMQNMQSGACGEKGPAEGFVPPMFAEWHRRAHSGTENTEESATQK